MTNAEPTKLIYGYPEPIHALAQKYIGEDILKCDNLLIDRLLKLIDQGECMPFSEEFNVDYIRNYYDRSIEAIEGFLDIHANPASWIFLSDVEMESLANNLGFHPQEKQIFEWWAVTERLADKLIEFGEPVLKNPYGYWWGRTCTGQAIILDGIMQKIAESHI